MLTNLSIRNIVLIEKLDLEFDSGLTVLTGETGAGKSILLDALGLALGSRADFSLVRAGENSAQVIASFAIPSAHPVRDILLVAMSLQLCNQQIIPFLIYLNYFFLSHVNF